MSKTYQLHKYVESVFINYRYKLHNSFVFKWESDFLAISKSGYVAEVEIKISKSDFNNDAKKVLAYSKIKKHDYLHDKETSYKPNKFFYAFPEGLIKHDEVDINYGIIELGKGIVRNAKFLHKKELLSQNWFLLQMMKKFYYRNIDLRIAMGIRDFDIKYNQKRLFDVECY